MAPIATYVFLDLGTTGTDEDSDEITEFSMVAISRQHLFDAHTLENPRTSKFLSKLTRCVKPSKSITYLARSDGRGGFRDEDLKDEPAFDVTCFDLIDKFLFSLAKPVCLIAHYGFKLDYLILQRQLFKLGVEFSDDLICVDTHQAFYDILEGRRDRKDSEGTFAYKISIKGDIPVPSFDNSVPYAAIEDQRRRSLLSHETRVFVNKNHVLKGINYFYLSDEQKIQYIEDAKTWRMRYGVGAMRDYPWGPSLNMPAYSYGLPDVYERVFQRPPTDAHKAEVDCLLMLKLAVKLGQEFVDWVDDTTNQRHFPALTPVI